MNDKAMNKFKSLIGLEKIKTQFEDYISCFRECRKKGIPFHGHMAIVGNPGTGKTTVARLFGNILHEEGLLSKGQFISVTPFDLVGEYIGQTRAKMQAVCDSAKGGVLFIDEAYGLINDFGREAIEVLIEFMSSVEADDTIVILSGYKNEMEDFLKNGNPGFKSRIPWVFVCEDYTNDELTQLFQMKLIAEHMVIGEEALACARNYFASLQRNENFGNARVVDNLLSLVKTHQAQRLLKNTDYTEDIYTISPLDFPKIEKGVSSCEEKQNSNLYLKDKKDEIIDIINELQMGLKKLQSKIDELR